MRTKLFLIIFLLAATGFVAKAEKEIIFKATGPEKVVLDQAFQIYFSVNAEGKDFRLPEIVDFDILAGPFTSHSKSTSITNGKTVSSVENRYTYTLLAKRTGKFSIPAASISVKKQKLYSNGLSLEVLPADKKSEEQNSKAENKNNKAEKQTISNENIFIRAIVSKTNPIEQEAVYICYRLYSKLDVINFLPNTLLDFKGFINNPIEFEPEIQLEHYNGENYHTIDLYKTILLPQQPGTFIVDKASFDISIRIKNNNLGESIFDSPFSYSTIKRNVAAPAVKINVKPFPREQMPNNFYAAVGKFKMHSSLSSNETKENEAVTLKISIEGNGNLRMIKTPKPRFPDSFEEYEPKVTNEIKVTKSGIEGKKIIEYLFIPRHAGDFEIPPVYFSYFDPSTNQYKTLATNEHQLKILKTSKEKESILITNNFLRKEQVQQLGKDIHHIKNAKMNLCKHNKKMMLGSTVSYFMFLIPLLITILLFFVLRKRLKENANLLLVKNKKANKTASKRLKLARKKLEEGKKEEFYDEVLRAIWNYLSDKLSISPSSLTRDKVLHELRERSVEENCLTELTEVLDGCEFARYAPNSGEKEMGNLFEDSLNIISKLEEKIKKK